MKYISTVSSLLLPNRQQDYVVLATDRMQDGDLANRINYEKFFRLRRKKFEWHILKL